MTMKLYRNPLKRITPLLLSGVIILASCEQSENDNNRTDPSGKEGTCTILPSLVTIEPFGADATTRAAAEPVEEQLYPVADELSGILTIANTPEENTPQTRALAAGTYYQLVIYKQADWNNGTLAIAEQRLCKTGSTNFFDNSGNPITNPIQLSQGQYKVFCYSHNSTTVKNLTLSSGSKSLSMSDGIDFLSAVVDMEIQGSQLGNTVTVPAISLVHRCCKLTGTLTAAYFDGGNQISASSPVPSLQVTGTFVSSGTWNIKTSVLSSTASGSNTKTIPLSLSGENFSGSIVVLPLSAQKLTATYSFKPEKATATVSGTNKALSAANTTFTPGSNHTFTIKAIGAYVLTDNSPVTIKGMKWAKTNLQANKTFAANPWNGGDADGANDYWRWNMLDVDTSSGYPADRPPTWSETTDPCRKASGSWRIPSKSEFDNLITAVLPSKNVYINGEIEKTTSTGWFTSTIDSKRSGIVFYDGSANVVFLPASGSRAGSSISLVGTSGGYWSSTNSDTYIYNAYYLYYAINQCVVKFGSRCDGFSLRCVQQ